MKTLFKFLFLIALFVFFSSCEHLTTPFGADATHIIKESPYVSLSTLVFEDFDGGGTSSMNAPVGDKTDGGNTTITNWVTNDASQGTNAMFCRYHFVASSLGYRFARLDVSGTEDLTSYNAVSFKLKGSGNKFRVILRSSTYQTVSVFGQGSYNDYGYVIDSTPSDWTTYTIKFSDFFQEDWGGQGEDMDFNEILKQFTSINFAAYSFIDGETGWFTVDDIKFLYLIDKR